MRLNLDISPETEIRIRSLVPDFDRAAAEVLQNWLRREHHLLLAEQPIGVAPSNPAAEPDQLTRELVLVELYREGKLYLKQLGDFLGLDRWQTEDLLRHHGVAPMTSFDVDQEDAVIRHRLGLP